MRLDCAALADHHRRLGFRLMDHLRDRLIAGGGGRDVAGVVSTGLGFEVQLHLPEQVTYGSAKANLDRIVNQHDQPQIEHLLLTAGGPDRTGMRFPGEEVIAGFLAEQPG